MNTIAPTTIAGTLTVAQLNTYVQAEKQRLEALGVPFDAINYDIPLDRSEVGWAVGVRVRDGSYAFARSNIVTGFDREKNEPIFA